jgi:phenylacetate-CoA ligase
MAWVWGAPQDMPEWSWPSRLKERIMRRRYLNAFTMTKTKMHEFTKMLLRWQPRMFRAYPSALALLAHYMEEHGINGVHPRLIETSAEKVTAPQRQLFEEVFKCPVADHYSSRELGTIAYPCPSEGLHVCETRYLEIVRSNHVVSSGQIGEIVITSLHQFAMPFIRYKNDDLGVYHPNCCACGRGLPVLKEVVGRKSDILVTEDGQFVSGHYLARVFRKRPEVIRFQALQSDKKHLETRIVCKQKPDAVWFEDLHNEIRDFLGPSVEISLRLVDHIELTPAGKHRFVISEVTPEFN